VVAQRPVNNEGLTAKQIICAEAIAEGHTLGEAARIAKVDPKTVHNWRNTAVFMTGLTRRIQERTDISGTQGVGLIPECLTVLKTIMNDDTALKADRIRAASTIMASANVYREQRETEAIIKKLEERIERLTSATTGVTGQAFLDLESATVEEATPPEAE
jgi:DNA-binding CsgD family transcriptional regulator